MHISCPNALIFLDFGYDWYFMLQFIHIPVQMKYVNTVNIRIRFLDIIFLMKKFGLIKHKISIYPKSRNVNAFVQELCIPTY